MHIYAQLGASTSNELKCGHLIALKTGIKYLINHSEFLIILLWFIWYIET